MIHRTDDPVADFLRHDAEQERKLKLLPRCCECKHPIQDEELFDFGGKLICEECIANNHKKSTEDYIQ